MDPQHLKDLLCTGGGDNSTILTKEFLSWSRRQSTNAFKAALDAEYAGIPLAGTMARFDPVLRLLEQYRKCGWGSVLTR